MFEGSYTADSLEAGKWRVLNSNSILLEEGSFTNGVRRGLWVYYPEKDSVVWNEVNIKDMAMRTNIPDFVHVVELDRRALCLSARIQLKPFR